MRRVLIVLVLLLASCPVFAADHVWQQGLLRDLHVGSAADGALSVPIGGTPPSTVAGVTIPGTAPTYVSVPITDEQQYVTIDGPDGLRYVARTRPRLIHKGVGPSIINDPITVAVEGTHLYVLGQKPGQVHKLSLVSTTRLPQ